jgi:predicted deacylase
MHTAEPLTLARYPSGGAIETTVHTYGDGDGPTLYVQAAQHGQEINGVEVLRRVHDRLTDDGVSVSGTLVVVPVADPLTFDHVSYTTPEVLDSVNQNMNRCWPGDEDGTLHERMAATLWEYVEGADAIVDLHTGGANMLTHTVYYEGDAECRGLAEAFGTELLLAEAAGDDADTEWSERNFGGKLRVAATRAGIPAITPELAHNKRFAEDAIETGVRGVLNVLRERGMLEGEPTVPDEVTVARNHLGRAKADHSGLFHPGDGVEIGVDVEEGDPLGVVYHPTTFETLQEVTAERTGVVYSVEREATVTAGSNLVGVAIRKD